MGSICGKNEQVSPKEQEEREQVVFTASNLDNPHPHVDAARIDQRIKKEGKSEKNVTKLLLLGAGESGKSTIFKQIKVLFQRGFTDVERKNFKPVVHANVFQSIKILIDGCQEFKIVDPEYTLNPKHKAIAEELSDIGGRTELPTLTSPIATNIQEVWRDPAIQKAFLRGNELQLPDCAKFFLEEIHRLAQPDYLPSQEDILYARVRSTGIVETEFSPHSTDVFRLFDVGGQRSERRKWIHLFEGVTAVIFCAALSEYDQVLFEDETKNRMMETKELFDWVLKQPWFEETSFLVFLNKFDIFETKIHQTPLTVCEWFSDYQPLTTGRAEVEHAYDYVEKKFREVYLQNTPTSNVKRVFQVYRTTALDKNLVKKTFSLVDETLTRKRLADGGLL